MENLITQHADELAILLMGLSMALVGGIRYARQSAWRNEAREAKARIVALEKVFVDTESYYGVYERPLLRYDTTGETRVGKIDKDFAIGELKVGDTHPILYNHHTPGQILSATTGNGPLIISFGMLFMGLAITILALALLPLSI